MSTGNPFLRLDNEDTLVLYGEQNSVRVIQEFYSKISKTAILCADADIARAILHVKEYRDVLEDLIQRGVKRMLLTEITEENLHHCKELTRFLEMRHLDGIRGNFSVSETEYMASAVINPTRPVTQIIYSNAKAIVQQHQYLFESLWNRAIPAEHRINELESGIIERTEVIHDTQRIREIYLDLLGNAKNQIMLMLPTTTAFEREEKTGIMNSLKEATARGVKVMMITPINHESDSMRKEIGFLKLSHGIDIRTVTTNRENVGMTVLVVDREASLIMESKDDTKNLFSDSVGSTVYTTSKPRIMSFVTIFESFWNQNELLEQVREVNKKLEKANERLYAQDRIQREFINIAAHELRTPIQPILGMAEIMEAQFTQDNSRTEGIMARDELGILVRNARRLERLSSDILEIARIETGTLRMNFAEFDLHVVITQLIQDMKREIANDSKKIQLTASPDLSVKGDKERLIQVVSNLLDNAIKFTITGVISVEANKKDNQIRVSVRDSGKGIDQEILPKLFTKFATKSERGTGLGLYISKSIIDGHGGKIWGENNADGSGATFTFTLPAS